MTKSTSLFVVNIASKIEGNWNFKGAMHTDSPGVGIFSMAVYFAAYTGSKA